MGSYNKFKSRRWIIALWAMLLSSFIVISSILLQIDYPWIGITLPLLLTILSVYIGAESYTKTHKLPDLQSLTPPDLTIKGFRTPTDFSPSPPPVLR